MLELQSHCHPAANPVETKQYALIVSISVLLYFSKKANSLLYSPTKLH